MSQTLLSDVCELIIDCEHRTAPTQLTGYPSIRTPSIGRGRLLLNGVNRVSEETYRAWTRRAVPCGGDLILAREAPVGNVAIVPTNLKVCLGQRTVLIRPDRKQVVPEYVLYLLLAPEIQGRIRSIASGATVSHLNVKDIRDLYLPPIPPLSTQRRIAAILSTYDDLIENNTRRIEILEGMASSIYREWFVNFRFPGYENMKMVESELGPIPDGWSVRSIRDFGTVVTGKTPSTQESGNFGGTVPFLKTPDMHGNFFCVETSDTLSEIGAASQKSKTIPKNSICVNCIGAGAGLVVITGMSCQTNQQLNSIVLDNQSDREFLFFALQGMREVIRQYGSNGATMINLNKGKFESLRLVYPPDILLFAFSTLVSPVFEQVKLLQIKNKNLRRTRDLLLPVLISGQVAATRLDAYALEA